MKYSHGSSGRKGIYGNIQNSLVKSCVSWNAIKGVFFKTANRALLPKNDWPKSQRILTGYLTMCLIGPLWWDIELREKIIKLASGLPYGVVYDAAEYSQVLATQRFVRFFAIDNINTVKFRSFFVKRSYTAFLKSKPDFREATDEEIDDFIIKIAFSTDSY